MNCFLFILLLFSLQLFASDGMAQRVKLNFHDAKVEDIMNEVERQTGYTFFYFQTAIAGARPVSIACNDCSLADALKSIQAGQKFDFTIENKTIIARAIVPIPKFLSIDGVPTPPGKKITGRITDPQGIPLDGATIRVKRTGAVTQANANGEFKFDDVLEEDILIITFTGFESKTINIGKAEQFPITLEITVKELNTFVFRGYGRVSERENLGNVTVIKGEEITRTSVSNPMRALIGKVPNVEISSVGNAYAQTRVEFRGRDLIADNAAPNPYIIIDGVPATMLEIGNQSSYGGGTKGILQNGLNGPANGQDLLFNLNPDDIESISFLKDASATAIYGSLGGAGVILITTKRGKPGKMKFEASANATYSKVVKLHDVMNTSQYIAMRKEAFKNSNAIPNVGNAPDLLLWDTTRNTNYQELLYGGVAKSNNFQVSISGGDKNINYRISSSIQNIANITNYSGSNFKASISSNFNYSTSDQKFKIGLINFFSNTKVDEITLSSSQSLLPPNSPPIFDSVGKLNYSGWMPVSFPFEVLLRTYVSNTDFLNTRLSLEYEILTGLKIATNIGYGSARNTQIAQTPIIGQDPLANPTGRASFGNNSNVKWIIEPLFSFQRQIGFHKIDVIAGATIHKINQSGTLTSGTGYVNDNLLYSISNAPNVTGRDAWGQYRYAAVFGRLNYGYRGRYLLEISARRDGSSRFGPGNRFGNFGAVGIGWILSDENWFKKIENVLSFTKFRANFGIVGSDNIGDYNHLSRWTANSNVVYPYQGLVAYVPTQHSNPKLQWQSNRKQEVGVQLGFLDDKLFLDGTWYKERCGNQLVNMPISGISGFTTVASNWNAVVENTGWEIILRSKIIRNNKIDWSANFNFGTNQNKLISFPGIEKSPYSKNLVIGEALGRAQRLHFIGVDPQTGLYTVEDKNKDGIINQAGVLSGGDTYFINNARIIYSGGFGTDFRYGPFELNIFCNYRRQPLLESSVYNSTIPGFFSVAANQSVKVLDRWQKPGDRARFAKYTVTNDPSYSFLSSSDGIYSNGSFIRLRNASFGFQVPKKWSAKVKVQSFKLVFKCDNLFTITKYEGVDPEVPALGNVPTQMFFTSSIQITL